MELIKKIESKKIGCRKYTMGLFLCECNNKVERIKRDGIKAKYCSHKCYANNRSKRGSYKPDKKIMINKYVYIYYPEHPKAMGSRKLYVAEHRLIMEKHIDRYLNENEIIHHLDEDTMNNNIKNLQIMTASEHSKHHQNFKK